MKKGQKLIPDVKRKRNLIAVRLADAELESLERIAAREDLPVAYLVREGIKLVIEKRLKK
jgi:predicted DNA-binding protein